MIRNWAVFSFVTFQVTIYFAKAEKDETGHKNPIITRFI